MYKKPENLGQQITDYYVTYFFLIFYAFSIGNILFLMYENGKITTKKIDNWTLIYGLICNILLFIPFHQWLKKDYFKYKEAEIHKKTYDDMYLNFITDYERANPMTRIEGEMRYLDKLEEKNIINKTKKDKRKKKIEGENPINLYLRQQRMSRIINIKELGNILNLDDDEEEENIFPKIESYRKVKKTRNKNTGRSGKILFCNETGTSIQKLTKKDKSIKRTSKLFKKHNKN